MILPRYAVGNLGQEPGKIPAGDFRHGTKSLWHLKPKFDTSIAVR